MTQLNNKSLSRTRYNYGVKRIKHRNVIVTTSLSSEGMDNLLKNLPDNLEVRNGRVPVEFAHRPDLISNIFYNTPGYWWLLMLVNGIDDPYEGFREGDPILIPLI